MSDEKKIVPKVIAKAKPLSKSPSTPFKSFNVKPIRRPSKRGS